jgi:hypothetical protein
MDAVAQHTCKGSSSRRVRPRAVFWSSPFGHERLPTPSVDALLVTVNEGVGLRSRGFCASVGGTSLSREES